MSASIDTTTATGRDRFRALLEAQRIECVHQREDALAECAQSVPDPVAQRRSADLLRTIEEIDAALDADRRRHVRHLRPLRRRHPRGAAGAAAVRRHLRRLPAVALTDRPQPGACSAE